MDEWSRVVTRQELVPAATCGIPDPHRCWIIADTHFFHKNIRGYTGRPENADDVILAHWRERVAADDIVLHLGDLAFGHAARLEELLHTLPGRLLLLQGNHDRQTADTYARLTITLIPPCTLPVDNWTLAFTHALHPELVRSPDQHVLNIYGHIHEKLAPDLHLLNVSVEWTTYRSCSTDRGCADTYRGSQCVQHGNLRSTALLCGLVSPHLWRSSSTL